MRAPKRVLVLGVGNEYLRDDGVGLVAARRVARLAGDRADLAEVCLATLDLLWVIAGRDRVIVIDAYLSKTDPPGTAIRSTPENLPHGFGYRSFHTLPFGQMLSLGRRLGLPMPGEMSIHGLCVEDPASFGQRFTPPVARAWRPWAEQVARTEFGATGEEEAPQSPKSRSARPETAISPPATA